MTSAIRHVAVVDIGKTNAKVALVDLDTRRELVSRTQPNRVRRDGPYPHHDVDAIWTFVLEGLAALRRGSLIDAVSVTTHGATAALVDIRGELVLPVLDYEFDGPDEMRDAYGRVRAPFSETGSPALPAGLNLGAQLFWQQQRFSDAFAEARAILTYPQFWTMKLTGVAASEVTSLGCHTDLWNPHARDFSTLVGEMGWRRLFPPMRRAADMLGSLLPEIATRTGIDPETPVACGIHDSNASLLPHLVTRKAPFAVVSTGTWVVSMAVGGRTTPLDPARDTLVNVNAFGDPVPSARFMGGREFERLVPDAGNATDDDWSAVLSGSVMLLPSVSSGSGPFPARPFAWHPAEPMGPERRTAASFYLALMTATCLDLVGADGEIVVEGPFAGNGAYLAMLAAATGMPVAAQRSSTGTSLGAALLLTGVCGMMPGRMVQTSGHHSELQSYARQWNAAVRRATP
ncbi:FGGY-family carbohydrate kinase [Mesorhizobium sp. 10J20-29]